MYNVYIYDVDFEERLQYSHSSKSTLEEVKKGMGRHIFYTENIRNEKPIHNRCWVVSTELLEYAGTNDMIIEKLNY